MLFFIILFSFFTTATAIYVVLAIKNFNPSGNRKLFNPKNFRGLFQPTEKELRALEKAEKEAESTKTEEAKRLELQEKISKVDEFTSIWRDSPSRRNTIEILYLASQSGVEQVYSQVANSILEFWNQDKIETLSADDLAQLLESHYWLIPAENRTSGVNFGLNQEIASLRLKSLKTE
jgi:hypothetical protein